MSLSDKITVLHAELTQRQKVMQARALIQPIWIEVLKVDAELQAIADSGVFNTVDAEIKQVLIKAWNVLKDAKVGFEDIEVAELLDWRP